MYMCRLLWLACCSTSRCPSWRYQHRPRGSATSVYDNVMRTESQPSADVCGSGLWSEADRCGRGRRCFGVPSGVVAGGGSYGGNPPKFQPVGKFSCKSTKCVAGKWKSPIFGKFRGKIEILSTHKLICGKCTAVCRSCNFMPHQLFEPTTLVQCTGLGL